ncbi:ATP synthase F0, B subunit [Elusimicrobium minutum Pei191]|uniref:ATP synthase subunit b n=1 Tax=Elusimicrobium minutum (strain Pei191) TaxID=445932 RepID=ATPF_ELUMP|nr:F0F1 ATP synthase subunit B [Elusimicrobium minutum]B2KEW8.1 RecName: Full=ATP synthase subunit b; AltName: Full=ATP synthase F(0) sector subunit b; AltName: Full=ATPase subunit I; AltName: Full=F-type ATPase subunit b; Short=F-ATPase subunit b [Elusimicrobium minutum Pei191]ACC99064.1 ATP synthase F0, B subunit [Elusimicrobium minutum Pei191]
MNALLTPDYGLIFWTIVNFLLLVFLLGKFAWKPIIGALEARENKISQDKKDAQEARDEAQKIKAELDVRLSNISKEAQEKLAQVEALAKQQKDAMIKDAQASSERMIATAKEEIEAQKNQALKEVKKEIADMAVEAAAKIAGVKTDPKTDAALVDNIVKDIINKA